MKPDTNSIINKLVAYAMDNLLLDTLDQTYAVNRLASIAGLAAPSVDCDAEYGDATYTALLDELAAAVPNIDRDAVKEVLFPMPRTVNYYLENKLARGADKAFAFLFDLYEHGDAVSQSPALGENGFICYYADKPSASYAALDVGGQQLGYTPIAVGNYIATLKNPDLLTDDTVRRLSDFAAEYDMTAAVRAGSGDDYMCCKLTALDNAKTKKQLKDGPVKVSVLDYPVPALAFGGIAKNAVLREVCKTVKSAADAGFPCVVAASGKGMYVVFAKEIATNEYLLGSDVLAACGIFRTKNCTPLLSVLEKGTALSTDLAEFRAVYDKIGGIKHGKNAPSVLGGALVQMCLPLLSAAASATTEQVESLISAE